MTIAVRRSWFIGGILLGVLLGLWPAYELITATTTKLAAPSVAPDDASPASSLPAISGIGPACATLAERIEQVLRVIELRQHAHSSFAAYIGAGWIDTSNADYAPREKGTHLNGRPSIDVKLYNGTRSRLRSTWKHERSQLEALWGLLADAQGTLLRCEDRQDREGSGPGQPGIGVASSATTTELSAAAEIHLEELHVSLIHDIVLSGIFRFEELSDAIDAWGCLDGPTTGWIKEMADLKVEATA